MHRLLLGSGIALALSVTACQAPLDVAPYVDTSQVGGTWFEIGHMPRTTQDGCSGTTATYLPMSEDGHFSVTHACTLADGHTLTSNATLYVLDKATNAKLGIDLGGFVGDYWILEVASDYRYMVVGHPSRDYLWILARDKHMTPADLDHVLTHAKNDGFDTSIIEYTNQDGGAAPQSNSGCSASPTKTGSRIAFGLGALALVALLRRRH